jgi:hypothetical protein
MDRQYRMIARQEAGHEAYRCVEKHGEDLGTDIIEGYFTGFALALVAVMGREGAEDVFRNIIGSIPPAQVGKPNLRVVSNG